MNNTNILDINENDFETKVINASENKLIVVDFWAPWCGPCKQLTPTMEKVAKENQDEFDLIKINIDENQQIASQLRIQSIPTVYAFKDKKIINAFQGAVSEKDFIDFIEKSAGKKLKEDFNNFYNEIKNLIEKKEFDQAKDSLLTFLSENAGEKTAISLYLECLLGKKEFVEIDEFISSLDEEVKKSSGVEKIIKKIKIINETKKISSVDTLFKKLNDNPNDTKTILSISDQYFSSGDYENAFHFLLDNYSRDKEKIKKKFVEFFEALGNDHNATKTYRKKLSSLMFS